MSWKSAENKKYKTHAIIDSILEIMFHNIWNLIFSEKQKLQKNLLEKFLKAFE